MQDAETEKKAVEVAAQVAAELVRVDVVQGRAFLRTPIMFPSGSFVVVMIEDQGRGEFKLSDLGQGLEEADQIGIGRSFKRQAGEAAQRFGLEWTGTCFVLRGATRRQLAGATVAIANAVSSAAERALARAPNRPQDAAVERLVARLQRMFPTAQVKRGASLQGASTHEWNIDAMIALNSKRIVLDFVTPNPISVAFASAKFHDIARLDIAPRRISVVHRKVDFGDLLPVVAQASSVVEADAGDEVYAAAIEPETA